ncbi:MAG TPA: hypothetical protein VGY55_10625 [Pirellulales bacterium]|nr:hypothetical protein [Pirellulales bacterium]
MPVFSNQVLNVAERLRFSLPKVSAAAFVLDQQHPAPEEIDESVIAGDIPDRLLESRDGATANAEDREEFVPKRLFFRALASRAGPFAGKQNGVLTNFVPRNRHGNPFTAENRVKDG